MINKIINEGFTETIINLVANWVFSSNNTTYRTPGYVKDPEWSDLSLAAINGDTLPIETFLREGGDVNDYMGSSSSLLYKAADNGKTEAVKLLLKAGANVDAKTSSNDTALYAAARAGYEAIAKL